MGYKLVYYPDPILKTISQTVTEFNESELLNIKSSMIQAMEENGGIGLAAIQIGIPKRIIVMKHIVDKDYILSIFINPEIIMRRGNTYVEQEGCLSFPEIRVPVERSSIIELKWQDISGTEMIQTFNNLEARIIQHEIDHMYGKTFIDRIPDYIRIKIQSKLTDLKRAYNTMD